MTKSLWGKAKAVFADPDPASTLPMLPPGEEAAYATTVPQSLARVLPASAPPRQRTAVHDLIAEVRKANRVCPQPVPWQEFYRLLQDLNEGHPLPAAPLVGKAWSSTPTLAKRMCFREQVEWAVKHDCIIAAHTFLKVLPESDWYYTA